jgi:hypothetical protein
MSSPVCVSVTCYLYARRTTWHLYSVRYHCVAVIIASFVWAVFVQMLLLNAECCSVLVLHIACAHVLEELGCHFDMLEIWSGCIAEWTDRTRPHVPQKKELDTWAGMSCYGPGALCCSRCVCQPTARRKFVKNSIWSEMNWSKPICNFAIYVLSQTVAILSTVPPDVCRCVWYLKTALLSVYC